jgi:antitoxin FitA
MHSDAMATTLQVRNVPDAVSERLKVRAASEGRSLSEYVLEVLLREASLPTRAEAIARLRELSRAMPEPDEPSDVTIRRMRDERS